MEDGWTTAPYPATNLSIYVNHLQGQGMISVALRTPLEIRLGICMYKTSLPASTPWLYWFHTKLSPHILQQNCTHAYADLHNKLPICGLIAIHKPWRSVTNRTIKSRQSRCFNIFFCKDAGTGVHYGGTGALHITVS